MINSFKEIYLQNLESVIKEIELYKNEGDLWVVGEGINNSAGNLALHLIGNLNYFIGARLGNTGYVRERDKEFSDKNIPKEKILSDLNNVKKVIEKTLSSLTDDDLNKEFGPSHFAEHVKIDYVLIYMLGHLNYHLGQINYHRRLLVK